MALTPEQRRLRSQLAAEASWANTTDRAARTANARAARMTKYEQRVDPDAKLDPEKRRELARKAQLADMRRMSYLSSVARSKGRRAA